MFKRSSQSQQHSPSLPLPLPISFDSTPQPISLPRFSPSSTPPLSHHNPVSSPPSSNTDVPEPLSPESVASPLPSSPSPSSLSSPPSVPSVPSNTSALSLTHEPPLRHSTRHIQPPAWHHDYAMFTQFNHSSTQSSSRQAQTEPSSFEQADCDPRWRQAMSTEFQALERNNTWEMVPLPPGHKPIGCRWVYKIKYHSDGTIERYKARLVAKGYTQVAGIDYQETFSPTAKLTTLRCLLTIAASRNWYIHQLDVHNAFLHGNLQEEVYMTPPPGLRRQGENLSKADYSLFTKSQGNKFTTILIYVDDILLTEFSRSKKGIFMSQRKYALDILQDTGLTGVKPEKFPMEQNLKLTNEDGELLHDPSRYQRLVGRLIYLTVTRPDIVYSVRTLSQFMNTPRKPHWEAALRVLRYIKGSPGQGLFLPSENNLTLSAFCDSDWGGCRMSRRSVSGYCVFLGSSLISWK
ncbi:Retrovirus-related Pol polyprotein from transposon RE2 [Vitis vinifera]|uniref:Retrovirus-related Pol polyprotein from transposon RE2 n=1 Tax=Vitis vinifera TaxID=29760 RepID=A0A438K2I7_VITVI|nr:Retrovirus-related Pol polyprotein from transposon RE2 [Vitis vinifera]